MLTQVEVDPEDPAFKNPTKPIGSFMTKEEADKMVAERGYQVVEDAGRGYRRVVASPKPKSVVELDTIRALVDSDHIVVACGGGGIPVFKTEGHHLKGAAAVIDKDFASEVLAEQLDADYLIILTAVEKAAINFGKPEQKLSLIHIFVHCPESNMASAVGCADIEAYSRSGLSLGLGTDGFSSDLFLGMRTASLLCRHNSGDALSGAGVASDLLFRANPSLASRFFGVELGVLKPGAAADIIVCDYQPPTPLSAANADSHILRGVCGRSVTTTVVAGKVLMENRILKVADEEALLSESSQQAADLWLSLIHI